MRGPTRSLVATASVLAVAAAVVAPPALTPQGTGAWLLVPGLVGVALSISSVVAEPRELMPALLFASVPAMGLVAEGGAVWLIGPLATLLLVGAELNAWSWELGGGESTARDPRRRLMSIALLAGLGLAGSLAVSLAARSTFADGWVAVALAAGAVAGLAWVVLPGGDQPTPNE